MVQLRHQQVYTNRGRRPSSVANRAFTPRPTRGELYKQGKALRDRCPRQSHAFWRTPTDRPEPLFLLKESSKGRIPELIPIRYGRMMQSSFTFYRGAALNMAADLAKTPATGLRVQACGDAHLLNFGLFATPERREIFDINDLDETLPAPWEWDVKRLAASFILASRHNGFSEETARHTALACVRSYRHQMAEFSEMPVLELWYASIDVDQMVRTIKDAQGRKRLQKRLAAARHRSVMEHDFPKLVDVLGQQAVIKDNPPLIYHRVEESQRKFFAAVKAGLDRYRETLEDDRRLLLDRYEVQDVAIKVVGVGSVGTWCGIALLLTGGQDPLFLQIKEARPSVLEAFAGKSIYPNHGQRVVNGCRVMQSASDIFLGWTSDEKGRHFYVRQLRDVKVKMLVEVFNQGEMRQYAKLCGWALARAHACSGQPASLSGYLGKSDKFDQAIAKFSIAYADQSERDHKRLLKAVHDGRLEVVTEADAK